MKPMDKLYNVIEVILLPALMAVIGWLVKLVRDKAAGKRSTMWGRISSLLCALFAGVLTRLLLDGFGASELLMGGLSGLAGYSGGAYIDILFERGRRAILTIPGPGAMDNEEVKECGEKNG